MKKLLKVLVLTGALAFSIPGFAQRIHITLTPPAIRTEVVPDRPSEEMVWQPGYFRYDATLEQYVWVSGQWVTPPTKGLMWVPPHYRLHEGEYHFVPGHWRRLNHD